MIDTAVFGGSFDPVHNEHIEVALACVNELNLKRLILVPTCNPPHKQTSLSSFQDRVEMLNLAFNDFPAKVIVSSIENNGRRKNYSADNLPRLKDEYGDFYYIIGGDSLLNFENWYKPDFIAKNFKIVVFNREGYPDVSDKIRYINQKWGTNIRLMEYCGKNIDSHTLRAELSLDLYKNGLPQSVEEYIKNKMLYREYDEYLLKMPAFLSEKRYTHSRNTALMASVINDRCKLNQDKKSVIIAGLLHDLGKKYDYDDGAVTKFDIPADSLNTPVQHQFIGAIIAKKEFNIVDDDILNAIAYHTTARPNMSTLEKIIYVADMLSPERDYPKVNALRFAVFDDFDKGFLLCLNYSYSYLQKNKRSIYPLTTSAKKYYEEKK